MWVRGHSRSLKVVPFESSGTVSYSPSIVTMAVSLAISEIFSVKQWPDLEIWVWGHWKYSVVRQTMYNFLLVCHCNYSSILYRLRVIDVEYYRGFEIWVKGHSRSLKLMQFENFSAVSYSPSIVTMAISVAVCKICSVKVWPRKHG